MQSMNYGESLSDLSGGRSLPESSRRSSKSKRALCESTLLVSTCTYICAHPHVNDQFHALESLDRWLPGAREPCHRSAQSVDNLQCTKRLEYCTA